MHCKEQSRTFHEYLKSFFSVLKISEDFEIIKAKDIITKCVLIENNNVFFTSTSLNLEHHS
jgi:hypothetical protein